MERYIQESIKRTFCTPKEWDTCEVEKRTCTGCYYENETPEKKIERLEIVKNMLDGEVKLLRNELQQEKEKNKQLEKVIDMMAEDLAKVPINDYMTDTQKSIAHFINVHLGEKKETVKQYYFKKAKKE